MSRKWLRERFGASGETSASTSASEYKKQRAGTGAYSDIAAAAKMDDRDVLAAVVASNERLRGAVIFLGLICFAIVIINGLICARRQYPLYIPGYSDKPVYISENKVPRESMRMVAEYVAYLTQTYSPDDYMARHDYAVIKYFAPGARERYEKSFAEEYDTVVKDRISASYIPEEFIISMESNSVIVTGFTTLYTRGVEMKPMKLKVTVKYSQSDKYGLKVESISPELEK